MADTLHSATGVLGTSATDIIDAVPSSTTETSIGILLANVNSSSQDVTVDYAVTGTATGSGTDYTLANGTLTINAGATSGTITIASIVDDAADEANETVILTLSNSLK